MSKSKRYILHFEILEINDEGDEQKVIHSRATTRATVSLGDIWELQDKLFEQAEAELDKPSMNHSPRFPDDQPFFLSRAKEQ